MEQGNGKPRREKGDALIHGRISSSLERITDRLVQRGDLEVVP